MSYLNWLYVVPLTGFVVSTREGEWIGIVDPDKHAHLVDMGSDL